MGASLIANNVFVCSQIESRILTIRRSRNVGTWLCMIGHRNCRGSQLGCWSGWTSRPLSVPKSCTGPTDAYSY